MKSNLNSKMKMLSLLLILIPFLGISQTKNVLSTHRVFPKIDKVLEFEKALAMHAKKYHSGDTRWSVFEIQSGPDFGGFQITEGPKSWESEDTRGNMGDEHMNDWNKSVTIHLTERQSGGYSVYQDSLSTSPLTDFAEKTQITHLYPKPGYEGQIRGIIKNLRKVWQANGQSVAVYSANGSGPSQFSIVFRYKQGLKEKTDGFRKPFKTTYEGIFGDDSMEAYLDGIRKYTDESWSEIIFMRKDLGSK